MAATQNMFMGVIPVKKIVIVNQERFCPSGYREPVEVRPVSIESMKHLGDLSKHILYLYKTPNDKATGIFRIFLAERE